MRADLIGAAIISNSVPMKVDREGLYERQATIASLGAQGIAKLRSRTVAVAGVGGVGSSVAYYLARSGLGRIILIDQDIVEPSNLQRIHSATKEDLYHPKAEVVARKLREFDRSIRIDSVVDTITRRNVTELLEGVDLVLDGLDNFRTRYVLNKFASAQSIPYVFISAVANQAHIAVLNPPNTPCLECIMPHVVDRLEDSCEALGVTPRITGIAGAIGAENAIQILLGVPTQLTHQLMTLDLDGPEAIFTTIHRRENCSVCWSGDLKESPVEPAVTLLCGERTANVLPNETMSLNISSVATSIPNEKILLQTETVLVYKHGTMTISLFGNGRILIAGVAEEERASAIASEIWDHLTHSKTINLSS